MVIHCTKFCDLQAKEPKDIEQNTISKTINLTLIFDNVTSKSIGVIFSLGASTSLDNFKLGGQKILSGRQAKESNNVDWEIA